MPGFTTDDRFGVNQRQSPSWPVDSANLVVLQWTGGPATSRNSGPVLCKFVYDDTHHYIRIVDHTTNEILDTIDAYDIVGADVAIDMNESSTALRPRVLTDTATDQNPRENPTNDSVPMDTQAHAKLTLYVYPRKPPNQATSIATSLYRKCSNAALGSFTCKYTQQPPTPNYTRPSTFQDYSSRHAHHRTMVLQPMEDLSHATTVVAAIRQIAGYSPQPPATSGSGETTCEILPPKANDTNHSKHYLIVCNPKSGPHRNAVEIAEQYVIPMLTQANIETTLCVTTHPGHAVDLCRFYDADATAAVTPVTSSSASSNPKKVLQRLESDIVNFNGIVVMGGDGTLHEVIQGIQSRTDAALVLDTIPIGIIGCGTANGLATSLSYASFLYGQTNGTSAPSSSNYSEFSYKGIMDDIFAVAKGHTIYADLSTYTVLVDHDPSSESDTQLVVPADENQKQQVSSDGPTNRLQQFTSFLTYTYGIIAEIDIESELIHWVGNTRFDIWAVVRVLFLRTYPVTLSYTTEAISSATALPCITEPIPSSWTTVQDKIVLFWASQVSHVSAWMCGVL
jgi:Diacylglycerol kinase catalytic domain